MRGFVIVLCGLILISCSTTMPSRSPGEAAGIGAGTMSGIGAIFGNRAGHVVNYSFLPPVRRYDGINPVKLYEFVKNALTARRFELVTSDRDAGIVMGMYPKGTVKKVLNWRWDQCYRVLCVINLSIDKPTIANFYFVFWVEEKPPLSREYAPIEPDGKAEETRHSLLSDIDQYVADSGGKF